MISKEVEALSRCAENYHANQRVLQLVREEKLQCPGIVLQAVKNLLKYHSKNFENEIWDVYERGFLAALECFELETAEQYYNAIASKFSPQSMRVRKLDALKLEVKGDFQKALDKWKNILQDDPVNSFAWKRQACICRAQGQFEEAIDILNNYLKTFSSDESAWQELAQIYIALEKYELAQFCFEELILLAPFNFLYHTSYAEVLYTVGTKFSVSLARQYFAQSLELCPRNNTRALFGLILCLRCESRTTFNSKLLHWTIAQIKTCYANQASSLLPLVEEFLK